MLRMNIHRDYGISHPVTTVHITLTPVSCLSMTGSSIMRRDNYSIGVAEVRQALLRLDEVRG